MGVWVNQGGWPLEGEPVFHAALEPCTGYPDRLDIGIQRNEDGVIPALGTVTWHLRLVTGRAQDPIPILRGLS